MLSRLTLFLAALLLAAVPARAGDVVVFAASSLKTALDRVAEGFTAAAGHNVTISYAGSSQLARQIQLGAPANVYLSANTDWVGVLEADGLLAPGTRRDLLGNRLVLIAPGANAPPVPLDALEDALGEVGHLAMALVEAVPAGIYGKAALTHLGLWDAVAPRVAQADNVRAALALVATGEAPLGIVYATDANAESRVSVVARFPEDSHPPITYPVAAIAGYDDDATRAYLGWLGSAQAQAVFIDEGFTLAGDGS